MLFFGGDGQKMVFANATEYLFIQEIYTYLYIFQFRTKQNKLDDIPLMRYGIGILRDNQRGMA